MQAAMFRRNISWNNKEEKGLLADNTDSLEMLHCLQHNEVVP